MTTDDVSSADLLTEEAVAQMAQLAGFAITPERLATVTDRLRDLYRLAADLNGLDLTGYAPATAYDPAWADHESVVI